MDFKKLQKIFSKKVSNYFGISKYLNCWKSILKVKVPRWRDFHVHGAMGTPYWPILACDTCVQVNTQYFEKFKINISTCHIQMKLST